MIDLAKPLPKALLLVGAISSLPHATCYAQRVITYNLSKTIPTRSRTVPSAFYIHNGNILACDIKASTRTKSLTSQPPDLSSSILKACPKSSDLQGAAVYTVKSAEAEKRDGSRSIRANNISLLEKGGKCAPPLSQAYEITNSSRDESAFFVFKILENPATLRISPDCDWSRGNSKVSNVHVTEQTIPFAADFDDYSILIVRTNDGYEFIDTRSVNLNMISKIGDLYFVPKKLIDGILSNSNGNYGIAYSNLSTKLSNR